MLQSFAVLCKLTVDKNQQTIQDPITLTKLYDVRIQRIVCRSVAFSLLFCFIAHSCSIVVTAVGWAWCDWSLPSVLWHSRLGHFNQSINQFISRHSTEARATVRLCRIKEKCLKADLKCVNGWSSSTVQWKRVPKSGSSNRETMSSSVQVVRRNWQKLLWGWSQP